MSGVVTVKGSAKIGRGRRKGMTVRVSNVSENKKKAEL